MLTRMDNARNVIVLAKLAHALQITVQAARIALSSNLQLANVLITPEIKLHNALQAMVTIPLRMNALFVLTAVKIALMHQIVQHAPKDIISLPTRQPILTLAFT